MILAANTQSPTRVVPKHRKPAGYLIRVSARAGGSDDRDSSSPRAGIWSIREVLPAINPVVFLPTCGGGPLRRSVEPTRTLMAPLLRIFSRGPREILNLCRPPVAAGKPLAFFHRALRVCQDFACEWTKHLHLLRSAPTWGLVALSDGHRGSKRKIGNVRKSSGEIRNVIR